MNKQTGPKHGEMLGETVCCVKRAALQWLQTLAAPTPLLHTIVPAQTAEHTHGHTDGTAADRRWCQADGERSVCPVQTVTEEFSGTLRYFFIQQIEPSQRTLSF